MSEETMDGIPDADDGLFDTIGSLAARVLITIRSSFLAFVVTIGVVFIILSVLLSGHVLPGFNHGILAGMTFIWGISAFLYALLGKVILRLIGYS